METKTVYAYDDNGKYLGEQILDDTDRSPLSGAWQIPGNMTEVKPPRKQEGHNRYYVDGKWEYREISPPAPPVEEEPQESPVDPERLAVYEAMAAQEERLAALEAALKAKGGDSK